VARTRPRRRYVVFRVESESPVSEEKLLVHLQDALRQRSPGLIYFDGRYGILRCPHTAKDATITTLNSIREAAPKTMTVRTLGTSGTIRRARSKFIR